MSDIITNLPNIMSDCIAWGSQRVHGSMLILEFGKPSLYINIIKNVSFIKRRIASVQGEWSLSICDCQWKIIAKGDVICSNDADHDLIEASIKKIDGQYLEKIEYDIDSKAYVFIFDLGFQLWTWRQVNSIDDQWQIFKSGNHYISLNYKGEVDLNA